MVRTIRVEGGLGGVNIGQRIWPDGDRGQAPGIGPAHRGCPHGGELEYIALCNPGRFPGVANKVTQTVAALVRGGVKARATFVSQAGLWGQLGVFLVLLRSSASTIVFRSTGFSMLLMSLAMVWQALRGRRVIIDLPTPVLHSLREELGVERWFVGSLLRALLWLISFPWCCWPAFRILEYSLEHPWFLLGIRRKTFLVANGVDVRTIPARQRIPAWPQREFCLLGVGSLSFWHGYDRVIRGVERYYQRPIAGEEPSCRVRFVMVGEGPELGRLRQLVQNLGLEKWVEFSGRLTGKPLEERYGEAHVAVSSLGGHRLGLELASYLKSREYCAIGIPFLASMPDPDFADDFPFVFRVPGDDSPIEIGAIIDWYSRLSERDRLPERMHEFAAQHLDFAAKVGVFF